jgi:hypothetical protein
MKILNKRLILGITSMIFVVGLNCLAQQNRQNETVKDEEIVVASFAEMNYPLPARLTHTQGIVVVRVKLDETGKVVSSEAISGAKTLIPDSLSNSNKWRFQAGPSKTAVIIYEFWIEGSCYSGMNGHFVFRQPNIASITGCELAAQP